MGLWQDASAPTLSKSWTVETALAAPHIDTVACDGTTLRFSFLARPGQTYSVLYCDSLSPAVWEKLQDLDSSAIPTSVIVTNRISSASRFYRLVTPAQP